MLACITGAWKVGLSRKRNREEIIRQMKMREGTFDLNTRGKRAFYGYFDTRWATMATLQVA